MLLKYQTNKIYSFKEKLNMYIILETRKTCLFNKDNF